MPTRREFLRQSIAASAVATAAPSYGFHILHTSSKKGPIIGHGKFKYRVHREWGTLDRNQYPVKDCHEMVIDKRGRLILLTNDTHNNVLVYDRSGKLLNSWGTDFPGAHGLTLAQEGEEEFLFITDILRYQVYKTTLDGKILMTLDWPKESGLYELPKQYHPTETAIAPNGDIFVADGYGLQYVLQYSPQGEFKRAFGGMGWLWKELRAKRYPDNINWDNEVIDSSTFNNVHGITLDTRTPTDPVLLITSRMDNEIRRYSLEGEFLSSIQLPGAFVNRAVIHEENVYASVLRSDRPSRDGTGFITILDRSNRVVSNPGGTRPRKRKGVLQQIEQAEPVFVHPHDVCIDNDLNLYVPQWNANQVYPIQLERV